jgi:D-alanyl-D-alanine carboxypeptidase/D-alanyl-D-alanine-endopeptidase (penicillin-binding protein 4)
MPGTFYGRVPRNPPPFRLASLGRAAPLAFGCACVLGLSGSIAEATARADVPDARLPPARASAATASARAATSPGGVQAQLAHEMAIAGSASGAYVYDVSAHRALFARNPDLSAPPASVEKLYTSTTALLRLGPSARLSTTVLGVGTLDEGGVWHGDLFLRGGGDPTFGDAAFIRSHYGSGASVASLAQQIAARGITRVTGRVIGDESFLDSLRGGPTTAFAQDVEIEGTLSGLAFDRGESGSERGAHAPAAFAARELLHALRAAGVTVDGGVGTGVAPSPPAGTELARVQSPPLSTLLGLMDRSSDNFFAEMLVKDLGALAGAGGSTGAGASVVRATVARFGVHPHVVDGSGLSHSDRTSPRAIVTLLNALSGTPTGEVLRSDLAVAGHSGTLALRMRATTAAGRCQAKTGTLNGVSNLAGWCHSLGGDTLAFAFFIDGDALETAHLLQDNMTITIAGY